MTKRELNLPLKNLFKPSEIKDQNSPSIFFLHGFGSNMEDLFGLSPYFPKYWNCISLQATIPLQFNGWAWAEIDFENILKVQNPGQIKHHKEKISESIDLSIKELNLDPTKIFILGFSQGAALSLYTGLTDPKKYKGIIALSGCTSIKEFENEIDYDHVKNLNVFMGNGRQDKIITLPLAQKTRDDLSKLEVKLNYKEYDVEHTISNDCLNDFLIWINTVLL